MRKTIVKNDPLDMINQNRARPVVVVVVIIVRR
ncbi:hypothetical protein SAMN05444157_2545 [Frankineae bacterium MT45]|nr:hypothetical protein SAMN05444157_2545 [Frankineae bacterium MT45]